MYYIYEKWLHISCFWKMAKKERRSQLIKTEVKEQRFMEIPPKVQASGHNRLVPDITLGVYISQILFRMMMKDMSELSLDLKDRLNTTNMG